MVWLNCPLRNMSNPEDRPDENEADNTDVEAATVPVETQEGQETIETESLENMILSTGIRVGTPVKTKFMAPFILKANPEGLYILDISKTLARIDVAAKFIGRA